MASLTRKELKAYFPDGRWARRVYPLPQYGCLYVKNAKAATSTVLLWLHRVHTGDHDFVPGNVHRHHELPSVEDIGVAPVVRMLAGEAFRFSFVREPVARVESAYLNKIAGDVKDVWRVRVHRALGVDADPSWVPSFEQFVASLESQEPIRMDPHWRPQHLNLMSGLVDLDLVGRLESFEEDLERVREATGMPVVPLNVRNARPPRESLCAGRPDLLRRVREVYARDFELYGY